VSTEYRAMWQELGINMPQHDLLMEALPGIFEKVYLGQQRRPQAMGFYDYVVSEIHGLRVQELVAHKEEGGKVFGTFCVYVPEEIIVAAGGVPSYWKMKSVAGTLWWPSQSSVLTRR